MNITRRRLGLSAVLLATTALAGCGSTVTPSQIASDANLIATGLASIVTALSGIAGVPPTTIVTIMSYLKQIQAAAAQLATETVGASAGTVQSIAMLVGQVAQVVLPLIPGGGPIVTVVEAAQALIPGMLALVGISAASAVAPKWSSAEARSILKDATANGVR